MFQQILSQPAIAVIVLIGALVFFHELGHFLVGRAFGVGVEIFSIGFGPRIFSKKVNHTEYCLSWIPLGGYVKFAGTLPSEDVAPAFVGKEFFQAATWKRALIIAAGPGANFLLAVVCFTYLGMSGIPHQPPIVGQVRIDGPADKAGILTGDTITEINGQSIKYWDDLQKAISESPASQTMHIVASRKGEQKTFDIMPESQSIPLRGGKEKKQSFIGIGLEYIAAVATVSAASPAARAGLATGNIIKSISWSGNTQDISSMDQFYFMLPAIFQQKAESLQITYRQKANLPATDSAKDKGTQKNATPDAEESTPAATATIDLQAWKDQPDALQKLSDKGLAMELARRLGIHDSQLTIKKSKDDRDYPLKFGDYLVAFGGKPLQDIYHLSAAMERQTDENAVVTIERDGVRQDVSVTLESYEQQTPAGKETAYYLPVEFLGYRQAPEPLYERYGNLFFALGAGFRDMIFHAGAIAGAVAQLITGELPLKALGGPMMIAKVAGDSAKMGLQTYLMTMALISINLGIINLFPIPVLDGGQLLLIGAEAIKRRRLEETSIENFQKIGFVLVLCLIILSTYNDLSRFWASMFKGLKGLF